MSRGITAREWTSGESNITCLKTHSPRWLLIMEKILLQAGYMGTYVEAVFTENYRPTVAQATEQPFF